MSLCCRAPLGVKALTDSYFCLSSFLAVIKVILNISPKGVISLKITLLWDVTSYSLADVY
jgi:hypothetical protein